MPRKSSKSYITLAIFSFFLLFTLSVSAQATSAQNYRQQVAQKRLNQTSLENCQAKENVINQRMQQLERFAVNMQKVFDSIAERVENYYATTVIPSGKKVENYDNLVADIEAKKTVVQTSLSSAKTNAGTFVCDGTDPKGQLTQFRIDMQAVKKALKEYRTSIKNLIVAVRSVTGEMVKNASPKPTKVQNGE